jgi:hypothetical protein
MIFVIPSLSRVETLQKKSIRMLIESYHIHPEHIHIFVVKEEEAIYTQALLPIYPAIHIHVGPIGLHHMRNHIHAFFPENTDMVCLDDDIESLVEMKEDTTVSDKKSCKRYPLFSLSSERFHTLLEDAFQALRKHNAYLFGIYPVKNGYFMKGLPEKSYNLRFCVGAFWGCINRHKESLKISIEEKEDVERTILYYLEDQCVLRYNYIAPVTRYYKEKGGMQTGSTNRIETSKQSCEYLLQTYPRLCKLYTSKKSGIYEIKLVM